MNIWNIFMSKFAVYGGGPVAMLLALMLNKHGINVEVWRPYLSPESSSGRRVFALNQRALEFLKSMGLNLLEDFHPIRSMQIWDASSFAQIQFNAAELGRSALAYTLDEIFLWDKIHQQLLASGIIIYDLAEDEVCHQSNGSWFITRSQADFLCIADGARSKIRQQLRVPCDSGSYQQQAIVAQVKVSQAQENVAFQAFGTNGPLAFLPLGAQDYSIVWSQDLKQAQALMALNEEDFARELGAAISHHLGEIIALEGLRTYPLHWLHAKSYFGPNWLLAGDAAHHFHPLAGLGLNSSIGDLICLSEILQQSGFSQRSLGVYQRSRKAQISPIMAGMQFLKNCFGIQEKIWVKCRSFGMDFLDHQGLIKKIMMKMMQDL
jgi:2-octaprenylphenol hydroxylase